MDKFKNLSTFYHINYNKKFIILKYNFFIKRLDLKILVLTYGCSIKWIEDTLIRHPDFALPGRKALLKSDMKYEVILIDATETPIERPKKNKGQE